MIKMLYKDLILVLVSKSSEKWSWYQIERALDLRGIGRRVNSMKIVNELIEAGYVEECRIPNKNISVYFVTSKGDEKVSELIDEYGNSAFDTSEKTQMIIPKFIDYE